MGGSGKRRGQMSPMLERCQPRSFKPVPKGHVGSNPTGDAEQ